eukprot:gene13188-biopygen3490
MESSGSTTSKARHSYLFIKVNAPNSIFCGLGTVAGRHTPPPRRDGGEHSSSASAAMTTVGDASSTPSGVQKNGGTAHWCVAWRGRGAGCKQIMALGGAGVALVLVVCANDFSFPG